MIAAEGTTLVQQKDQREGALREILQEEEALKDLQSELKTLEADLDEKTKAVDQVKRTAAQSSKVLDQALKEIATKVGTSPLHGLQC